MAEVITMLALSPTMEEGTLVEWMKNEGDSVAEGEIIAEIETDKATMEMESFHDGTILKLLVSKGDAIPVGAPLAVVGAAGEDISAILSDLDSHASPEPPEDAPNASTTAPQKAESKSAPSTAQDSGDRLMASPLAKRLAQDNGIDLGNINGSGPHGRVIKRDIEAAMSSGPTRARSSVPTPTAAGAVESIPLSQMRKTIARRLREVWVETPHFFLTRSIEMGSAMAQRKLINQQLADAGVDVKISVNDLIVKACAVALARYPKMNVSFQGDHVLQYTDAHVGVAVAVDDGLITPTVKFANTKPLSQIATEIREMAGRAREKRLQPDEYTGGTFSVSNLGMFGIEEFTAIINPPQAGILACGAVAKVPHVDENGELTVSTRMKVTLSCDHRAVDGAVGAMFLQELTRLLENPVLMLV